MRLLLVAVLACSLSACATFKSLPTSGEVLDAVKRAEVALAAAESINEELYASQVIDEDKYNSNAIRLSETQSKIAVIKALIEAYELRGVKEDLESIIDELSVEP